MNVGAIISLVQWILPLLSIGVNAFTKAKLPQELIDAAQAAIASLQKFIDVAEPTRAQVLSLDIDPNAWGPVATKTIQ